MERNFKKEIQEAASNPIDMAEMMAQLVQVRPHQAYPFKSGAFGAWHEASVEKVL